MGPRNPERAKQLPDTLVPPATDFGLIPNLKFSFADAHMTLKPGGWSREITSRELPVDETMAVVNMNLSPGVREMHSHLQSEWGFVLKTIHFPYQSCFRTSQGMCYLLILVVMNLNLT